ncbi:hypothetical protein, partial [Allopontixanthobacter sp.]|uniref:hypothetical protein n=1 Tax=Allopontixanthobacter sp. TaxID=2906452 RepID=UPI002ABCF93A
VLGAQRNLNERQVSWQTNEPGNDRFVGGGRHTAFGRAYRQLFDVCAKNLPFRTQPDPVVHFRQN